MDCGNTARKDLAKHLKRLRASVSFILEAV